MEEKDLKEALSQIEKWYNEDSDNRAIICIKTDKETCIGNSIVLGSRLNLVALLVSIAVRNEEFRKLLKAASLVLKKLKQPIETSINIEKNEGNITIS